MINPDAQLVDELFNKTLDQKPTRDGFGYGTIAAAKDDDRVMVLCADLAESTRAEWFQKVFPDRFVEVGIGEQNMAGLAAGFAAAGRVPFMASYAAFSPGRNYEQIRTTIALNQRHVIICGMHAGVSVGPDGATHQMLEDIGLMRMLPGMTVINPADSEEARKAVIAAAKAKTTTPIYIRFGRSPVPVFTTYSTPFIMDRALTLWESAQPKVTFFTTGSLAYQALVAARSLESEGIGSLVVHVPTIKPLDSHAIVLAARRTGHVITVEEHQVAGGFGSAVAELLSTEYPLPIRRLGLQDEFGQSGTPEELLEHYGLTANHFIEEAKSFLRHKRS